jgi:glycosyltransferase involved in cell wall biosynthesis
MTTPRLIHLADYAHPRAGSFVPMVLSALEHARSRGWRVDIVLPGRARQAPWVEELADAGIGMHLADVEGRRARAQWLARELGEEPGPTILHTHFTLWDAPAVLAARRLDRAAVVWHIHTTLAKTLAARLRNMAKFASLGRGVSAILCPAPNIAEDVRRRLAPRGRVHFLPSVVDVEEFELLGAEERLRRRELLGISAEADVLLHFGWHWQLKGGDLFLATVKELVEGGMKDLVAIERGSAEDAEREIAELGLAGVVRVQPVIEDIRTLFGAADLLVSSSRDEGMAYTVLEALSCGTPVVATDVPGHVYIGEHVAACRISDRDPPSLAATVRAMLDRDPDQARVEAREARAWITTDLGYEANAKRLMDVYERALAELGEATPAS